MDFYWLIEGEVAGHSQPHKEADLSFLNGMGIKALVRMSTAPHVTREQILKSGMEQDLYVPVPDYSPPSQEQLQQMVDFICKCVSAGKPVAVSCAAGIGRTGTVLACYLAKRYSTAEGVIEIVRKVRPGAAETQSQIEAIETFISNLHGKKEK